MVPLIRAVALCVALACFPSAAFAAFNLGQYQLSGIFGLPPVAASEASAVTWNWDTDTLFVLGDEGEAIVQTTRSGVTINSMTLTGFDDTEGITYTGGGRFVVTEERLQRAYQLTYVAGGMVTRAALPTFAMGATVGNVGIEDISYDRRDGSFVAVKEKSPQAVLHVTNVDFPAGSATLASLGLPMPGVLDLSGVQVLSNVPTLAPADHDQLLVFSQESNRLLAMRRDGTVTSSFDFSAIAPELNVEGVTIDARGVIYLVGENPSLYVLAPVPEPAALAMLLAGLCVVAGTARARRRV